MSGIVKELSAETGLPESLIRRVMASAPLRYKHYVIPKRSGGMRQIAQPAREVKFLQRAFASRYLTSLPIHNNAKAYRLGLSTRDNAVPHIGRGLILKFDFRDFFLSIRSEDWIAYCRTSGCITNEEDVHLTASLLFHRHTEYRSLRLAVGAPSSPILSNILMSEFDRQISELVARDKGIYTRYADDLTFSAARVGFLNRTVKAVMRTIRTVKHPRLEINMEKTKFVTSKYRRTVTGLTVTSDDRVTIGRESKRQLHAAVHNALFSRLSGDEMRSLAGTLAYINSVEPEFLFVLRRKYGDDIVSFIQRCVISGKAGPDVG